MQSTAIISDTTAVSCCNKFIIVTATAAHGIRFIIYMVYNTHGSITIWTENKKAGTNKQEQAQQSTIKQELT